MKIVLYSRVFAPSIGGMERFSEDLAGWLARNGHEVTVITRTFTDNELDNKREYRVIRGSHLSSLTTQIRKSDAVLVNGLSLRGIWAALLANRLPVVIHAGHQAICPTGLAWSPMGFCSAGPSLGPCLSCPGRAFAGSAKVKAHRVGARKARLNICVSRYLQRRITVSKDLTIYNPVSKQPFEIALDGFGDDGLIAFAGRLVSEKGLDLLLHSLVHVPWSRLEVAGDGPMRGEWERLAEDLQVSNRVSFLGSLPFERIGELYAKASVVCVPSAWGEPFGYSCAEAMAMGRSVVATPHGALPELLAKGRGFVSDDATPKNFGAVLDKALSDGPSRHEVGQRARRFAETELAIDVIGPKYVKALEEVID